MNISTSFFSQEYSVQITFREDWIDPRLVYDDLKGKCCFSMLTIVHIDLQPLLNSFVSWFSSYKLLR